MVNAATQQPQRIRSTCDACLEAKVRCSREKPSCRRCLHHKRECVYSFKRRLGRPRGTTNKSSTSRTASSTNSPGDSTLQDTPEPNFPCGLPISTPGNHDISMDPLLYFDHNLNFAGDSGHEHDALSLFPLWLANMDGQDVLDATKHDIPMPDSLPDRFQAPFLSNKSDASSCLSPRNLDSLPCLIDSSSSSTKDFASNFPSPTPVDATYFQQTKPPDPSDFVLPGVLSSKLTSIPSHPRPSPTSSTSPPARDSAQPPKFKAGQIPSRCTCYSNILSRLSELKDERAEFLAARVDNIMKMEKDIRTQTRHMMQCESCVHERPRTLLLVGVVLESVIDLLECVPVTEANIEGDLGMQLPESRTSSLSSDSTTGRLASVGSTLLQLGEFEISGEEKLEFLRHLVSSRLHGLIQLIRQLHEHMQQTCRTSSKAAATVMAELSQRVHALMNRLEG